jgi:hypothetical protein
MHVNATVPGHDRHATHCISDADALGLGDMTAAPLPYDDVPGSMTLVQVGDKIYCRSGTK